jgi:hypothetical protein
MTRLPEEGSEFSLLGGKCSYDNTLQEERKQIPEYVGWQWLLGEPE